jgi:hypothetical protein
VSGAARGAQRPRHRHGRSESFALDDLVRELVPRLAPRLAPLVLAEIAKLATNAGEPYSTRKSCAPVGWTDQGWRAVAASVPGTYRPRGANGKPGRWLVTPRPAYDAWVAKQNATAADDGAASAPIASSPTTEPWHPRMAAEALGLRLVRRPR